MANRTITATEFKAKCLSLLDEVNQTGNTLTITKRGERVATVKPPPRAEVDSLMGALAGKAPYYENVSEDDLRIDWGFDKKRRG